MKNKLNKPYKIILIAIFTWLCFGLFVPTAQAGTSITFNLGNAYPISWSSGTGSLRVNMNFGHYYGGSGYYGYRPSYSYIPMTRYVRIPSYPRPTPTQYMRDYYRSLQHLDQKYAQYLAQKEVAKQKQIMIPPDLIIEENEAPEIILKENAETNSPNQPHEPSDKPTPKEIITIDGGTVVMAMY
jgi:hypothetical protein